MVWRSGVVLILNDHLPFYLNCFSVLQREPLLTIVRNTVRDKGITGLYSGCSAVVIGNSVKAGVRFVTYDHFKSMLADAEVRMCFLMSLSIY